MKIYQLQLVASRNAQPMPSFRLGATGNLCLVNGPLCFTLLFNSSRSNRGRVSSILNGGGGAHRFACGVWPRDPDSDLLPFECFRLAESRPYRLALTGGRT
jgi:hypothetical protein